MRKQSGRSFFSQIIRDGEKGFSLVEIMVAAGMLGVVSLGVMNVMSNMSKGSKKLQQDSEVYSLEQTVRMNMRKQRNCTASFRGLTLTTNFTAIPDLKTARGAWIRSNAGDVIGNKNIYAVAGNVYGAAASRVTLASIEFAGFFAGPEDQPGTAANYSLGNTSAAYNFNGDLGATDGGANVVRTAGAAKIRLVFQRLTQNRGTDAQASLEMRKKSYGTERTVKYVNFDVVINGAGVIQECLSDQSTFVEASCDSLNGFMEDGKCKDIFIENRLGNAGLQQSPAVTVQGNLFISPDATEGAPTGQVSDFGSVGIGLLPNTAAGAVASNLDVAGSVGIGVASTGVAGDLSVNNSAAIGGGIVPSGNDGDLQVKGGFSVGATAPPATDGSAHFDNSVGIGVAPTATAGDLSVNRSVGIGMAPLVGANGGNLSVARGLGVGVASPNVVGRGHFTENVTIDNSVGVGTAASGDAGDLDILTNLTVGGVAFINGNDATASKRSMTVGGTVRSDATIAQIDQDNKHLTTKEWVRQHVGQAFAPTPALVGSLVTYIDNMSATDAYTAIKEAICSSMTINGSGTGNTNCDITGYNSITAMSWNSTNYLLTITERGGGTRTTPIYNCSRNGTCTNLYASNDARIGRDLIVTRNAHARWFCISGNCRTSFATRRCPSNQVVVAIGRGGAVGCAYDAR